MIVPVFIACFSLVTDVVGLLNHQDLPGAERAAQVYRESSGTTPELAAADSWIARGALAFHRYAEAEHYAASARQMVLEFLKSRKLDDDPWLPTALGAAIEVEAGILEAREGRGEALSYLREQLAEFGATSLHERIQKNINLLNLEGKPAPPLEPGDWLGRKPPPASSLRGHPVLLFFWAHWCSDCKAEGPVIASILHRYGPQGMVVIAPTRRYGYVAGGNDATPAAEREYIERVRRQYYAELTAVPVPLSAANFRTYGASTTPTLVLIDRAGVVRMYHPGVLSEADLSARIRPLMGD
jgi:thiol-disulfide isomerase/thioredoxin